MSTGRYTRRVSLVIIAAVLAACAGGAAPATSAAPVAVGGTSAPAPTAAATPSPAPQNVRIGWIKAAGQAGAAVAHEMGFDKELGVNLQLTVFPSAPESVQSLVTNGSEAAYGASIPTGPSLVLRGAPVRSVLIYAVGGNRTAMVTLSPTLKVSELAGKKIATPLGSSTTTFVQLALKANGVALNQAQIINMNYPDMPAAIETGQIDVATLVEPTLSSYLTKNKSARVLEYAGKYLAIAGSLFMTQTFAKSDVGYRTYLAIVKGMQYIREQGADSPKVAGIIAAATGSNPADVALGVKAIQFDPRITPYIWARHQDEMLSYIESKSIARAVTRDEMYDMSLQDRAMKEHPELFTNLEAYLRAQGAVPDQVTNTKW